LGIVYRSIKFEINNWNDFQYYHWNTLYFYCSICVYTNALTEKSKCLHIFTRGPTFSISHVYQSDGLRNLTEAVVQLVFREHMPMGLEYVSYPREVYAFLRLSIYH